MPQASGVYTLEIGGLPVAVFDALDRWTAHHAFPETLHRELLTRAIDATPLWKIGAARVIRDATSEEWAQWEALASCLPDEAEPENVVLWLVAVRGSD